jgi:O-antigen/teichoic acid export membrane protein
MPKRIAVTESFFVAAWFSSGGSGYFAVAISLAGVVGVAVGLGVGIALLQLDVQS